MRHYGFKTVLLLVVSSFPPPGFGRLYFDRCLSDSTASYFLQKNVIAGFSLLPLRLSLS